MTFSPFQRKVIVVTTLLVVARILFPADSWRTTLSHVVAIALLAGMVYVVFPQGLPFARLSPFQRKVIIGAALLARLSPFQRKVIIGAALLVAIRILFPVSIECHPSPSECSAISYVPGVWSKWKEPIDILRVGNRSLWFVNPYESEQGGFFSLERGIPLWKETLAHVVVIALLAWVFYELGLSLAQPKDQPPSSGSSISRPRH
jgi:hypothetical protein